MSYADEKTPHSYHASSRSSDEVNTADYAGMSVGRYVATRIPTLKPPFDRVPNPFSVLRLLNRKQWLFFLVAFFGWTWYVDS